MVKDLGRGFRCAEEIHIYEYKTLYLLKNFISTYLHIYAQNLKRNAINIRCIYILGDFEKEYVATYNIQAFLFSG